jgi:HEPN domain-containing protein
VTEGLTYIFVKKWRAPNRNKHVQYWITEACETLPAAFHLMRKNMPLESTFMAHLAVEKSLKALVVQKNNEFPPKTHNLIMLAEKAGLELSEKQLDFLETLNYFQLQSRYPEERQKVIRQKPRAYFRQLPHETGDFLKWCTRQLN